MLALVALLALPSTLTGQVLDSQGRPVVDAQVGVTFQISGEAPKPQIGYGEAPIKTDSEGKFELSRAASFNGMVVATGQSGAAIAELPKEGTLTLRLQPIRTVELILVNQDRVGGSAPSLSFFRGNRVVGFAEGRWGTVRLQLPQEPLTASASQMRTRTARVEVNGTTAELELRANAWAKSIGKKAPSITPTDMPKTFTLSQLEGKWVVVDFWATWCAPCIEAFPKWFEFTQRNATRRDRFEIVAIHSPDGKSAQAVEPALARIVESRWKGVRPPFPLLYDATGKTHERWGIELYPTTLLIDPQGRLVGEVTPEELQKRLDEER